MITVVASDRSGWNAVEPALLLAFNNGVGVQVLLSGVCQQHYADGILKLDSRFAVISEMQNAADLLLIATSQSAAGTKASLEALHQTTAAKVVVMQDLYGSALPLLQQAGQAAQKITTILVTDAFAKQHILDHISSVPAEKISITGGPHFDTVAAKKLVLPQLREELRNKIGARPDELLFLVTGQPIGTAETIALVEQAIAHASLTDRARIILRLHPRATWLDKRLVSYALAALPPALFLDVPTSLAASTDDLVPAADFIFSSYSTTNFIGVLYGMPGVVYVGTHQHHWALWTEKGLEKPPEVLQGAGWYAEKPEDLVHVITEVQKGDASAELQKIKKAQEGIGQYNDGHAAERVWQQLATLLK